MLVCTNTVSTFVPHHTHHVQTQVKIKNSNFFPVSVNVLNVTLSSLLTQVGLISYPPFSVKMRTTKTVSEKEEGSEVRDHCDLSHSFFQNFNAIGY